MNYSVKSNLFNSWASTYAKDFSQNHLSHLALDISYIKSSQCSAIFLIGKA